MTTQGWLDKGAERDSVERTQLRRLPWVAPGTPEMPDGKPCFLSTDDPFSLLSQMADTMEQDIVQDGSDVRDAAAELLESTSGDAPQEDELRGALAMAVQALSNVIRVAQCRGERLHGPHDPEDEGEDPEELS